MTSMWCNRVCQRGTIGSTPFEPQYEIAQCAAGSVQRRGGSVIFRLWPQAFCAKDLRVILSALPHIPCELVMVAVGADNKKTRLCAFDIFNLPPYAVFVKGLQPDGRSGARNTREWPVEHPRKATCRGVLPSVPCSVTRLRLEQIGW